MKREFNNSDITMCPGDDCKLKENCLRFKTKPNIMQSYFIAVPNEDGTCDFQLKIDEDGIEN